MRLFSDMFVKINISDHSYNVHIRTWCRTLFIFVDLVVRLFFLFHYWAKPLQTNVIYNFTKKKKTKKKKHTQKTHTHKKTKQ